MRELTEGPWGEAMLALARAVVDAQAQLDLGSHRSAMAMIAARRAAGEAPSRAGAMPDALELGLLPAFYQFTETLLDVAISVGLARTASGALVATLSPVAGAQTTTYGFQAREAARLRFHLRPVPPPLDDMAEKLVAADRQSSDSPAVARGTLES